jgi:hypothetical protein
MRADSASARRDIHTPLPPLELTGVLLADEINRAPAKTRVALPESRHVVDAVWHMPWSRSMPPDLKDVIARLQRDVSATLGDAYHHLIEDTAADVRELDVADSGDKLINDVQQHFHDTLIDATWPTCPRHARHPLWYRNGSWWCVQDGVAIAALGELDRVS